MTSRVFASIYVGGVLFQDNALLAFGVGVGLAIVLSGAIELIRKVSIRRSGLAPVGEPPLDGEPSSEPRQEEVAGAGAR
jgi:hypothetical protein